MAEVERNLRDFGFRAIAGTDEVGRGCLAGPVVAAAVILSNDAVFGLNDSKLVPAPERSALCSRVLASSVAWSVGVVQPETIDRINILEASRVAMHIAVESLAVRPDVLLVDAVTIDELHLPQLPMIAGDRRSVTIAAASIVAKVYRDSLMESYHDVYPQYGFSRNRGYGTESHWRALRKFGPTPLHRLSFDGVAGSMTLFDTVR